MLRFYTEMTFWSLCNRDILQLNQPDWFRKALGEPAVAGIGLVAELVAEVFNT